MKNTTRMGRTKTSGPKSDYTNGQRPWDWIAAGTLVLLTLGATGCLKPRVNSPGRADGTVGQPFSYQITATRNPTSFAASVPPPNGLAVAPASGLISGTPQQDGQFNVTLRARNADGEGTRTLRLTITAESHPVVKAKELFIIAPAVMNDVRAQPGGAWHIRGALQRIVGAGQDVEAFAQAWFATWANNDSVPGSSETFGKRPWVTTALQQAWTANRIRLIAIVNRLDLARFPDGDTSRPPTSLGEGRFVYEVLDAGGQSLPFTIIFEYGLPSTGDALAAVRQWARDWHALGRSQLGAANAFPAQYLAELQAITDRYSAHGTLNQIRANEFLPVAVGRQWEMREFHFDATTTRLVQVPVLLTPALANNNQPALATFLNGNQADIIAGNPVPIPGALQAAVSPVPSPGFSWNAPGTGARPTFITSFNTCSGCHAGNTGTLFQHIGANAPAMSPFLSGGIPLAQPLPPAANTLTTHDEMSERSRMLADLAGDAPAPPVTPAPPLPGTDIPSLFKARANRPH
jgi:hypothetical protein